MTSRLPKKIEKHLLEIAPYEGEPEFIKSRLEALSFDDAFKEIVLFEALLDEGFIQPQGNKIERESDPVGGCQQVIVYKPGFVLSAKAKLYIENLLRIKIVHVAKAVGWVIASVGGLAAFVNLILSILWH